MPTLRTASRQPRLRQTRTPRRRWASVDRGQSLVEFALVLPLLLVLLLGVADFGRVFAAGITIEAATRTAAEAAAQEYVQIMRTEGTLGNADYERLHEIALYSLCNEATNLPNRVPAAGAPSSPTVDGTIVNPCSMPAAAVCIHDAMGVTFGPDPYCNGTYDTASPPSQCGAITSAWSPANAQGSGALAYVEVRVCYQFTTLLNLQNLSLPFGAGLSIGDIYLQRTRTFTVACYYTGCS